MKDPKVPVIDLTNLTISRQIEEAFYRTVTRIKESPELACKVHVRCARGVLTAVDMLAGLPPVSDSFVLAI